MPHSMGKRYSQPIFKVISEAKNANYTYRPTVLSVPIACDLEMGLIQKSLPHDAFPNSATECLNLNVCVPKHHKGRLPVFIFVHGGGFAIGSNAWPQYDLARIVKCSEEIGKPVIGVQIKYAHMVTTRAYTDTIEQLSPWNLWVP